MPRSVFALALLTLLGAAPVRAASLQKVEQSVWSVGGLPGYVNMSIYVPDKLAAKPPILVASHHCGGSSSSTFNEIKATFVALADKIGFVIIMPEATGHNCWDVGSTKSLTHDGGGDTHAIAQMVRYALTKYQGDASRVYAFGTSSGAMMTEALLGVYPDLFMAGVSVAGVPCGCWAADYTGDSGANPQWSGPCAGGNVSKSAQAWGDLVRATFPSYTGHRPRVQLWHGTADTTISYKNLGESIKEWTNVLQLAETPSAMDSAKSGYTHQTWKNTCGYVTLEAWSQQGAGHNVSWDSAGAARFLGLDEAADQDPEALACPAASGGAGASGTSAMGSGGAGGDAGTASGAQGGRAGTASGAQGGRAGTEAAGSAAHGGGGQSTPGAGGATSSGGVGGLRSASAGMRAAAAGTSAPATGTAGAGVTAVTSKSDVPPASAAASPGGCSCAVGAHGALQATHRRAIALGALWLFMRLFRGLAVRRRTRRRFATSPRGRGRQAA